MYTGDDKESWGPPLKGIPRVESTHSNEQLSSLDGTPTSQRGDSKFQNSGSALPTVLEQSDASIYCVRAIEYQKVLSSLQSFHSQRGRYVDEMERMRAELRRVRSQRDSFEEERNTLQSLFTMETHDKHELVREVDTLKTEISQNMSTALMEKQRLAQTVDQLKHTVELEVQARKEAESEMKRMILSASP